MLVAEGGQTAAAGGGRGSGGGPPLALTPPGAAGACHRSHWRCWVASEGRQGPDPRHHHTSFRSAAGPFAAPSSSFYYAPVYPGVAYSYTNMPQGRQQGEAWRARLAGADGHGARSGGTRAAGGGAAGPQTMDALKARLMEAAPEEVRGIILDTPVRPR